MSGMIELYNGQKENIIVCIMINRSMNYFFFYDCEMDWWYKLKWLWKWKLCGGHSNHFKTDGYVAPSCKVELARFSASLRIQDGAECGN